MFGPAALLVLTSANLATQSALIPLADEADDAILRAAAEAEGLSLSSRTHTQTELASLAALGVTCAWDNAECNARYAILLRVERVLSAQLDEGTLRLVAIAPDGTVEARAEAAWAKEDERALRARRALRVLRGKAPPALLRVTTTGGTAQLDGRRVAPLSLLAPGDYALTLQDENAAVLRSVAITLAAGEDRAVALAPPAAPEEPLAPGWAWTAGSTTAVVGAAVFTAAGASAAALDAVLSFSGAGEFEERAAMQLSERILVGIAGAGLVAGAIGGGMLLAEAP